MLVRHLDELKAEGGTKVIASGADSVRYIVAADNAGFSVSDVKATGPTEATLPYKHHTEACVVIEGEGTIEDLTTGEVHPLKPGSIYVLYPGETQPSANTERDACHCHLQSGAARHGDA